LAYGSRGLTLVSAFLVLDCMLIWLVNTNTNTRGSAAPVASEDQFLITLVLIGAGIIAVLAAIFFKFKPVPACLTR